MSDVSHGTPHASGHAFEFLRPRDREGVVVYGRRSVLKSSLAGIGGLGLPACCRPEPAERPAAVTSMP